MLAGAIIDRAGGGSVAATLETVAEAARRLAGADTAEIGRLDRRAESGQSGHALELTLWIHDTPCAHVVLGRETVPFDDEERRLAELAAAAGSLVLACAGVDPGAEAGTSQENDSAAVRRAGALLRPFAELFGGFDGRSPRLLAAAAAAAAGARGAALARLSAPEEQLELVGVVGIADARVRSWRRQPLDADSPLAEAVRTQQPVFVRGALFPGELDTGSAVALPLTFSGRLLGALGLEYAAARSFGESDRVRLETLGAQAAEAFDRLERDVVHDLARRLQEVTALLAAQHSRHDIAETIVVQGVDALGAVAGSVALLDEERSQLRIVASRGYAPELVASFDPLSLDAPAPLADAARTGELIVLESPLEMDERYPEVREIRGYPAEQASVALPLAAGEEPFGAIAFSFPATHVFDHETRAFLLALSRLCAQALDRANRARLYDRTARLQAVTTELAKALTQADVGRVIIEEVLAALGARGGRVALRDPDTGLLTTIAAAGYAGEVEEQLRSTKDEASMPVEAAALRNELVLIGSLEAARDEWPVAAAAFGGLGDRAVAAIPLRSHDAVLGVIGFTWSDERRFAEEDVSFLGALAGVCAQALERTRLYEESERSGDRLRHLLDHLGEAVIAVDSRLRVTYANEGATAVFGRDRLVGRLLPERWPELRLRALARSQLGPDAEPLDERTTLADGRTLEVVAMAAAGGVTLVLRDVSRRERQERAEREFVANAAHELRTPLAAIASAGDALQRGAKDLPAERDFYISGVVAEVDRLVRLSDALLLLARVQTDPQALRLEHVELEPLLTNVAARLEVRPGVRVLVDAEGGVVLGELALLESALTNVARNASRHTSSGTIRLSCHALGEHVEIAISDTGTGMSEEIRARAGDRFFRGVERDREGFGLGLALAQEMVLALGGEFEIVSQPRAGTTIKITLAAAE